MNTPHDGGYKRLFSHPEFVRDLITGFVPDPWLQSLDFTTLERYPGSYVPEDLKERADDIVWRLKVAEDWCYVYLLIEFQSTVDPFMAVRVMTYLGLLYQDLTRPKKGQKRLQHLPPVLPIVLYNGHPRWTAPVDMADLIPPLPAFLERFRPRLRYFLISEWAYPEEDLPNCHNLVAALFRLERLDSPEGVVELLEALNVWLDAPEQRELRRSIAIWLRASLMQHKKHPLVLPELDDLQEIRVMLSEQMGVWAKRYHQEGRMEGKQEGLREGVQQGLQKGLQKGVRKGRQEGLLEGEANLLRKQMERRFGALPTWAKDRLAQANQGDLETWGEAILTAPTLEAVFTDTSAH